MPVFIVAAYDENGKPNCMNAAWGGMYTDNTVGVCIDISHKTTKDILKSKAFTISMATVNYVAACDYVGIVSGNNEPDKFAKAGFSATMSEFVNAPVIKELPVADDNRVRTAQLRRRKLFHDRKYCKYICR